MTDLDQRLAIAQKCLKLKDVFSRKIYAQIDDDYHPFDGADDSLVVQTKIQTTYHQVLEQQVDLENEPGENPPEKREHIEFKVLAAARFVDPQNEDQRSGEVVVLFSAVYSMTEELENDVLVEFGLKNAPFHVWPYWRELLHSAAGRLRLPSAVLPMYHYSAGAPEKEADSSENEAPELWTVNVNEPWEMMYWTSAFSINESEFRDIVASVGSDAQLVMRALAERKPHILNAEDALH